MTKERFSTSEEHGLGLMSPQDLLIYSVGISTGGVAEIRMAQLNPNRQIIATTIDSKGADFATRRIAEAGLNERIQVKLEDVAQLLPYKDGNFDYIYARLVLHYLSKQKLKSTLGELHRVLQPDKKLFVVVRSVNCPDAQRQDAILDPETCLTTCEGKDYKYSRYFHTDKSISDALVQAGFAILSVGSFDEQLFVDFERTKVSSHMDNVIEVVAKK